MPIATYKAIVYRLVEEGWNDGNLDVLDQVTAPHAVTHDPATPALGTGPAAGKHLLTLYRTGVPDLRFTIEDMIAEDDRVVARWTGRGTHQGGLLGMAPTGKPVTVTGITIVRFVDAKIVESWVNWDTLGMMQQLGVIPAPRQATG